MTPPPDNSSSRGTKVLAVVKVEGSNAPQLVGLQDPHPSPTPVERGARLRRAIGESALNQSGLAEALGCHRSTVSRYVNGDTAIPPEVALRISHILDVEPGEIAHVPARVAVPHAYTLNVRIARGEVFQAALYPIPDDHRSALAPKTELYELREQARSTVKEAVLREVTSALDRFFAERTAEISVVLKDGGELGELVDMGQGLPLAAERTSPLLPPHIAVTVSKPA